MTITRAIDTPTSLAAQELERAQLRAQAHVWLSIHGDRLVATHLWTGDSISLQTHSCYFSQFWIIAKILSVAAYYFPSMRFGYVGIEVKDKVYYVAQSDLVNTFSRYSCIDTSPSINTSLFSARALAFFLKKNIHLLTGKQLQSPRYESKA